MSSDDYETQVQLLMRVLPLLRDQPILALKGGTAINLFVQDLPRLSVDIDLAYTGREGREGALANIHTALLGLHGALKGLGLHVQATPLRGTATWVKLVVGDGGAQVKVELSPVLRGTVFPPQVRQTTPAVQARFGFAEASVLALPKLYAGKLVAALDRQHPRDLYDVRLLLAQGALGRETLLAFLVYLISHGRPLDEVLRPHFKDLAAEFNRAFVGMTVDEVPLAALEQARIQLVAELHAGMAEQDRAFLLGVAAGEPDWGLLPLQGVAELLADGALETAQHRADGAGQAASSGAQAGGGTGPRSRSLICARPCRVTLKAFRKPTCPAVYPPHPISVKPSPASCPPLPSWSIWVTPI